jgi:hypothetical protein
MKILHSVGKRWEKDQVESLSRFGIEVKEDIFSYVSIERDQFELIKDIIMRPNRVYFVGADFDKADMEAADWLALTGLVAFGYPQPDGTFDFLDVVYDTSHHCKKCGVNRGRQKNPFRISSDKTKMPGFQLEWIHDEIFVKREVYDDIFLPLGIEFWPVLIHRSGQISEHVVQLDLPECDWDFDLSGTQFEICEECGKKKYQVTPMDFLPPLNGEPPNQIFHGREYYGSGGQADRRLFLSQELRQKLMMLKIARWHQFYPLRS